MASARQWNWDRISNSRNTRQDGLSEWLTDFDAVAVHEENDIPATEMEILRHSLDHGLFANKPLPGSTWLLRNHDTREYVRLNATLGPVTERYLHVEGVSWLSLDKALIMRICWTTSHQCESPAKERILRGQWAGQRFDVICTESSDREHYEEGWTDVTAAMVKEAQEWRSKS